MIGVQSFTYALKRATGSQTLVVDAPQGADAATATLRFWHLQYDGEDQSVKVIEAGIPDVSFNEEQKKVSLRISARIHDDGNDDAWTAFIYGDIFYYKKG